MAEPKDVTFELNVFGDDPKSHLKLTGPGTPPLEFVVSAFKRMDDARDLWGETQPARDMARAQRQGMPKSPEPPPDRPREAPRPKPAPRRSSSSSSMIRDPSAPASKKQLGMVRGLCGKVNDEVVISILGKFEGFEGVYTDDGHYLPSWDFLNILDMGQASDAIEALKKVE